MRRTISYCAGRRGADTAACELQLTRSTLLNARAVSRRFGSFKTHSVCAIAALAIGTLSAAPIQHPKRLINSYTVDLEPLFKWWSKHEGPRPLASWVHITGSIVATNAAGWVVEAELEDAGKGKPSTKNSADSGRDPQRIILMTPPVEDLVEYEKLTAQLTALNRQRAELAAEENEAKSREQAVAEQKRAVRRNGTHARVLALEERQLKQVENEAKTEQKPLDQQIQELKSKLSAYSNSIHYDHFILDCFALDRHFDYERLPVYDHGQVLK